MSSCRELSLSEVQARFASWRSERTGRATPRELRSQAVSLLSHHPISEVMKALRLDHKRLKRWREAQQGGPRAVASAGEFIELAPIKPAQSVSPSSLAVSGDSSWAKPLLTLTHCGQEGRSVSIAGELDERSCRWALSVLLEVVG